MLITFRSKCQVHIQSCDWVCSFVFWFVFEVKVFRKPVEKVSTPHFPFEKPSVLSTTVLTEPTRAQVSPRDYIALRQGLKIKNGWESMF